MASDLRWQVGTIRHPKFKALARALGPEAVFALIELWEFCALRRTSGDLSGFDDQAIADAAGWDGPAADFVESLVRLRLLDRNGSKVLVHEWREHQPWVAAESARQRSARIAGKASAEARAAKEDRTAVAKPFNGRSNPSPFLSSPILSSPEESQISDPSDPHPSGEGDRVGKSQMNLLEEAFTGTPFAPSKPAAPKELHPLAVAWNAVAEPAGFPKVTTMSKTRLRHATARLAEADVETWSKAYALIVADPFCAGDNDRAWRADFDYALRPEKSGKWLDRARSGWAPTTRRRARSLDEIAADEMARRAGS